MLTNETSLKRQDISTEGRELLFLIPKIRRYVINYYLIYTT